MQTSNWGRRPRRGICFCGRAYSYEVNGFYCCRKTTGHVCCVSSYCENASIVAPSSRRWSGLPFAVCGVRRDKSLFEEWAVSKPVGRGRGRWSFPLSAGCDCQGSHLGVTRPNRRIFYNFILYLKWSSMFVETSVTISEKSDEKWGSYS